MTLFDSHGPVKRGIYGFLLGLVWGSLNMFVQWFYCVTSTKVIDKIPPEKFLTEEEKYLMLPDVEPVLSKEEQNELDLILPDGYSEYSDEEDQYIVTNEEFKEEYKKCKELEAELRKQYEEEMKSGESTVSHDVVCLMNKSGNESEKPTLGTNEKSGPLS